jgi:preprotein translocase subunit Sec61beta
MASQQLQMPGYGGLTRFKEEYDSPFKFSPGAVVVGIVATILLVIALKFFFPVA